LQTSLIYLEDAERLLSGRGTLGLVGDNVESNGLGKGTALTDSDNITILNGKCRRAVGGDVLVPLLESAVLQDVVKVVSSDNDGVPHLGGDDHTIQNSSTDGNISGERTLLVDIVGLNGTVGSLDSETDVLDETHRTGLGRLDGTLAGHEDGILLLVCLLGLVTLRVFLRNSSHLIQLTCAFDQKREEKKLVDDIEIIETQEQFHHSAASISNNARKTKGTIIVNTIVRNG
jgi:hypothetical protein